MCPAVPDWCGFAQEPDITTAGSDMEWLTTESRGVRQIVQNKLYFEGSGKKQQALQFTTIFNYTSLILFLFLKSPLWQWESLPESLCNPESTVPSIVDCNFENLWA